MNNSALPDPRQKPFWAVLLAGGDGTRLRSLTLKIAGDSRPKQFCRSFGDKSLLGHTRERLRPLFHEDRTIFVVTKAHEAFYREDLFDADAPRVVVQPRNRGTGVAIAVAILRVLQHDADAIVAFFPCDHYYGDETAFASTVRSGLAFARERPQSLILLGTEPKYPEIEYGWIEPGPPILNASPSRVAVCQRRWAVMLPLVMKEPVEGSYSSALDVPPPATRTFPLGRSVAVCPALAAIMLAVAVNVPADCTIKAEA